ncbi:MAG TPA: DUF1631 domain-containing protein [Gammaproteobacteria bacterium]|nr:DUF1631 domain-containing protein [Gammaproteobacteria bacterium]
MHILLLSDQKLFHSSLLNNKNVIPITTTVCRQSLHLADNHNRIWIVSNSIVADNSTYRPGNIMTKQRNIIDFTPPRHTTNVEPSIVLPQLVVSAQRTIKHQLRQLLPDFFSRIDDSLFDMADKAESNQQQTLYFDAMREVRLQKDSMQDAYFKALTEAFQHSLSHTVPQIKAANSLDQAGLMEDEQLEESLAITNMVTSAEGRSKEALFGLTMRLNYLIEDIEITKDNNPLRPEILFNAFIPAVKLMDADIKVRLVIYKLFDKFVAQKIGPIYDNVNADLIASGVLPRIKSTVRKSEDDHVNPHTAIPANTVLPTDEMSPEKNALEGMPAFDPNQPEGIFNSLQQLLSMTRATPATNGVPNNIAAGPVAAGAVGGEAIAGSTTAPASSGEATTVTYAPQQVLAALNQIQSAGDSVLQQSQQQPSANIIKSTVIETIAATQSDDGKEIAQADTDAIDIVSMLFDFILDDPSLPDNLKAQIARLQIPLLKVAIIDKGFFAKKTHPARQLLNELAYAGSGLEEMDPEEDAVFQMVSYVVDSILAEFEENTEIFSTLHDEFVSFIEKERESNRLASEMLENAKDLVAGEIQRRVTNNRVPPLVSIILIDAWKDVLTHLYLRDGDEGAGWNTALQVADDLIWSVQPKLSVSERQRLVKIIPRVLNGLRDGLTLIQFDHEASEQLFAGLEALHLASLRGGLNPQTPEAGQTTPTPTDLNEDDFGIDMSTMPEADSTNATQNGEDSFIEEIILASTQPLPWDNTDLNASQYAEEIKDMALGTWVEFINAETKVRSRGKLAWKCDFTGEYTFVDRKYKVVADLSNRKLIEEFESGRASFVDDVPLFDRALDSVIGGIKRALNSKNSAEDPVPH